MKKIISALIIVLFSLPLTAENKPIEKEIPVEEDGNVFVKSISVECESYGESYTREYFAEGIKITFENTTKTIIKNIVFEIIGTLYEYKIVYKGVHGIEFNMYPGEILPTQLIEFKTGRIEMPFSDTCSKDFKVTVNIKGYNIGGNESPVKKYKK